MTWRLRIRHSTGYRYDTEVVSSYNEARITPQTSPTQLTLESRVETVPDARQYRYWDYWGTQVTAFDVQEPHSELEVVAHSVVDSAHSGDAPGDCPDWTAMRDPERQDRWCELLSATGRTEADEQMREAALAVAAHLSPPEAVRAVSGLVHDTVAYETGSTGVQTSAVEAWRLGRGV